MDDVLKDILVCPISGDQLSHKTSEKGFSSDGLLVSEKQKISFPIQNDIPRFVN